MRRERWRVPIWLLVFLVLIPGAVHAFYNPKQGRWLSREPLGEAGSINLYEYVGGNPVNYIDPLGLWTFGFGLSVSANTIGAGGMAGFQVAFSHAPASGLFGGWNLGLVGFYGGGAVGPIPPGPFGAALTFDVSQSLNPNIEDLCGSGTEAGGSATFLGVNLGGSIGRDIGGEKDPLFTGHLGIGGPSPSPWSGEGHGYYLRTGVLSLRDSK